MTERPYAVTVFTSWPQKGYMWYVRYMAYGVVQDFQHIIYTFIRHKSRSTISTRQDKNVENAIKTHEHLIKQLVT